MTSKSEIMTNINDGKAINSSNQTTNMNGPTKMKGYTGVKDLSMNTMQMLQL